LLELVHTKNVIERQLLIAKVVREAPKNMN